LIEVPNLTSLSISSLNNHVSVVDNFEVSSRFLSWDDMEISLYVESEFFIEFTLGWFSLPLVNVDDIPLLMDSSVLGLITLNVSSFWISGSLNVEIFVHILLEGSNVSSFGSEQLPPSWVDWSSCSNVWMSSVSVDFHDIVLPVLVEDGLGSFIESPLSMYSMSWSPSSQVDPMVSVHGYDSLHWHSWSNVEWSIDIESEFFILTLGFNLWSLVNIDNLPFLVSSTMVLVSNNWLSFSVFSSWYIKNLGVLDVDELFSSVLEDLPPLWVGALNLHLASTTIALDVPWLVVDSGLNG